MFLAILAHDLRNPLNGISLSAQVAATSPSLDADSSRALSQIEKSAQAIDRLIRDLIDFASSGLGSGMPLSTAPINLQALCTEVVAEMRAGHPQRQFEYQARGEILIDADAGRLRQVLSNLLGNAVQHGKPGTAITLGIEEAGPDVALTIHNDGSPIPAPLLPILFDPLVRGQVTDPHRSPGSIGLGLHIVREIAVAHGGSVEVSSSKANGTVFTVRLPGRRISR